MEQSAHPADVYPIQQVRFRGGRTYHRTKKPADWYDLLEAACGKTGYLATAFSLGEAINCLRCQQVIADAPQSKADKPRTGVQHDEA